MVRRRQAQMELSQVVLFGLVLPEPERLMEPWLREVDKALGDEEIVEAVMTAMRGRWQQSARRGRAGTPAEVVLRMLALKHLRDWSVVEAPIHHPTDSGLCEDVIRVLSRAMMRLVEAGAHLGVQGRERRRRGSRRMSE